MNGQKPASGALWEAVALGSRLGFLIAFPLSLLTAGGAWLDARIGTAPWFLIAGVLAGLGSAGYSVWKTVSGSSQSPRHP